MITGRGRRAFEGGKFLLVFFFSFCKEIHSQGDVETSGLLPDCDFGVDSVSYYLFTRNIPGGITVDMDSEKIPVKPGVSTIFLVNGFTAQANTPEYLHLTQLMINKYDVNVLSVDWKEGACSSGGISLTRILSYPTAVSNTKNVGETVSKFIGQLISRHGLTLENINFVGHSLGAHVVGFAGKDLQKRGIGTAHRILGIDPAGLDFESNSCSQRLCITDARFVQIFHTSYLFGIHKAVGNVDFYFNGGSSQPGCPTSLEQIGCSHAIGVKYLINILQNPDCKFIGKQWDRSNFYAPKSNCSANTCSIPGPLAAELPARGTFYVDVKDRPSFCFKN